MSVGVPETQMATQCRNVPLRVVPAADLDAVAQAVQRPLHADVARLQATGMWPMDPVRAYAALFAETLDPYMARRVRGLLNAVVISGKRTGFVYVFRDERDASGVVKIGSTTARKPDRRIAQWRRDLMAIGTGSTLIRMLWALPCHDAGLAERVLHALLWCQHVRDRVNVETGRRLVEYFAVDDWPALRTLCRVVCRFVNAGVLAQQV